MGTIVENPRYNVLSGRFSEKENEAYRALAKTRGTSISDMVREALELWREKNARNAVD